MDQEADPCNHQDHDHGERVDQEAQLDVQPAYSYPVPEGLGHLPVFRREVEKVFPNKEGYYEGEAYGGTSYEG